MTTCKGCKWAEIIEFFSTDEDGELIDCFWPTDTLPYSMRYANRERVATYENVEHDCPAWEKIQ